MLRMKYQKMIVFERTYIVTYNIEDHTYNLIVTFLSLVLWYYMAPEEEKPEIKKKIYKHYLGFKRLQKMYKNTYLLSHLYIPNLYEDIKLHSFFFNERLKNSKSPIFPRHFPYTLKDIDEIFKEEKSNYSSPSSKSPS